jgi:VTC domain
MDGVELMNRTDTKFVVPYEKLISILNSLVKSYRILEVNGVRENHYETLYYDTPDFHFYMRHHNGKKNRWKIRKRSYVDSDLNFLELKFKTNRGRTKKQRVNIPAIHDGLNLQEEEFIHDKAHLDFSLIPQVKNNFTRITLVEVSLPERITIDFDLNFGWQEKQVDLPNLVIVEVKQENHNRRSPFVAALKQHHIREESISKYCLGVALLVPNIKRNTFKEKLLKLKKIQPNLRLQDL